MPAPTERKPLKEWIKNYRCHNEMVNFFTSQQQEKDCLEKELTAYQVDAYTNWFHDHERYLDFQYAKNVVIPSLKDKRRQSRQNKYLVVTGADGYEWCGFFNSVKSVSFRNGKYHSIIEIVCDSLNECRAYNNQSRESVNFSLFDYEGISNHYAFGKIFIEEPSTIAVNCPNSYWEKLDKIFGKQLTGNHK